MFDFNVISPETIPELLKTIQQQKNKPFRLGAGGTDLLMELKKQDIKNLTIINLSFIKDKFFTKIITQKKGILLGGMVTAEQILNNSFILKFFPVLYKAAYGLASPQIRHVATVGGNLCTASPSGDISCALVALKSDIILLSANNKKRIVPSSKFFTGVRKTVMKKNEFLYQVFVPFNPSGTKTITSDFIKIGTRQSMECSVVSLGYHILANTKKKILNAGVAIGSVAPSIRFTDSACDYLIGKEIPHITPNEREIFANKILGYASPIDDIRGSAWYRKKVLFNISKAVFE